MAAVELYWLPLGAGGWFVRLNGRIYEAAAAAFQGRARRDLYHAGLLVAHDGGTYAIELGPESRGDHGRVAGGPVGARWAGRLRIFRYEARCWRGGIIPDIEYAVASPVAITDDAAAAARVVGLVPEIPTPVWGRDELCAGEMWNSNSVIAWLLERAGLDADEIPLPDGGGAPGWKAGVVVARRAA